MGDTSVVRDDEQAATNDARSGATSDISEVSRSLMPLAASWRWLLASAGRRRPASGSVRAKSGPSPSWFCGLSESARVEN